MKYLLTLLFLFFMVGCELQSPNVATPIERSNGRFIVEKQDTGSSAPFNFYMIYDTQTNIECIYMSGHAPVCVQVISTKTDKCSETEESK